MNNFHKRALEVTFSAESLQEVTTDSFGPDITDSEPIGILVSSISIFTLQQAVTKTPCKVTR